MKATLVVLSILTILLSSCSSKIEKWEKELDTCISRTDTIQSLLKNKMNGEELTNEILEAEIIWNQLKLKYDISDDTLTKEQMDVLDDFNVAFHNARNLKTELLKCLVASSKLRLRLERLKNDIDQGNGKRSEYCSNVQHEKEELTIIEKHANDIHRRFEELKRSKAQFNEKFAL